LTICRERIALAKSLRERDLQNRIGLHEADFQAIRPTILVVFDRYESFRQPDRDRISASQVWSLCKELGILPQRSSDRRLFERDLCAMGEAQAHFLSFGAVVRFILLQRETQAKSCANDLALCFRLFERERFGSLSLSEASQALSHFKLVPLTKEGQHNFKALYASADPEGTGRIDRVRFLTLWLRVHAELQVLQYEAGLSHGISMGFSELEVRKMWQSFGEPDQDDQIIKAIGLVRNTEQLLGSVAVGKDGRADEGSDREQDFKNFVQSWCVPFRVGEEDLRPRIVARMWTSWDLRRALLFHGLPQDYVHSLASFSELTDACMDCFGVSPGPGCTPEDKLAVLADKLGARSAGDLLRSAQAAVSDSQVTVESRQICRERLAEQITAFFGAPVSRCDSRPAP